MRGFIAVAVVVLSGSSPVEAQVAAPVGAQIAATKKTPRKPSLPTDARWVPQKEVIKRYGRKGVNAFKREPRIVSSMKKLIPDWTKDEFFGLEDNRVLRFKSGREILIVSGREVGMCDGYPAAIAFDLKSKAVAALSYYREMEAVPEEPVAETFSYENKDLQPIDDVFSILWITIHSVSEPLYGSEWVPPSACNSINDQWESSDPE